jgi:hypothetical protein
MVIREYVSREVLSALSLLYRVPGLAPSAVDPISTDGITDAPYKVADEFIHSLPLAPTLPAGRPYSYQYMARASAPLIEPRFAAAGKGTPWRPGQSELFAANLADLGSGTDGSIPACRFKRLGLVVRVDDLMVDSTGRSSDALAIEVKLAAVALVRALSVAVLQSRPQLDDADEAKRRGFEFGDEASELRGLPAFVQGTDQEVRWDSSAGMIGGLSNIEALCHPSDGDFGAGPDVFVMSSRARWRLLKELEDKGVTPDFRSSALTRRVQFHYHGLPVVTGRVKEEPAGGETEAWALKLFGPTGVRLLHVGGKPETFGIQIIESESIENTPHSSSNGVHARSVARAVELFGVFSLVVPEHQSVARLGGIPVDAPKCE